MRILTLWTFALLSLLNLSAFGQSQQAKCVICQRCSSCLEDVLNDSYIDTLYGSILSKQPLIRQAYPLKIAKTVTSNSTNYSFQFSNNYNISFQILLKNIMATTKQQQSTTISTQVNDIKTSSGTAKNKQSDQSNVKNDSSNPVPQIQWKKVSNASQILLEYSKKHFYLDSGSMVTSLSAQTAVNTYTVMIQSKSGVLKMLATIDPLEYFIKVLNITFVSGASQSATNSNSNSNAASSTPVKSQTNFEKKDTSSETQNNLPAKINSIVPLIPTINEILTYLRSIYPSLNCLTLQSYNTNDNQAYSLNFYLTDNSAVRYFFRIMKLIPIKNSNLRGSTTPVYQILDSGIPASSNNQNFNIINNAQSFNNDLFAKKIIDLMNQDILTAMNLKNLKLVSISSSTPFYRLAYEESTKRYEFLVSYDILTSKVKIINQTIGDPKKQAAIDTLKFVNQNQKLQLENEKSSQITTNKQGQQASISEQQNQIISSQKKTIIDDSNYVRVKPVATKVSDNVNNNAVTSQSTTITTEQSKITTTQSASSSSSLLPSISQSLTISSDIKQTYINFRTDQVFLKAYYALTNINSFNGADLIKVSETMLAPNIKRYTINLDFHLQSKQQLQFWLDYNLVSANISTSGFTYTPFLQIQPSQFKTISLENISKNKIVMDIISELFLSYPNYFSQAVSSVKQVSVYPPYFNLTFDNSVYGILKFTCVYNYLLSKADVTNFSVVTPSVKTLPITLSQNTSEATSKIQQMRTISTSSSVNQNSVVQPNVIAKSASSIESTDNINDGLRLQSLISKSPDYFCIRYANNKCQECIFRFFYDNRYGKCMAVQDECSNFDLKTGVCFECFSGYMLIKGLCVA